MTTQAYRDCVAYAESLGLECMGIDGKGHMRYGNPETGESVPLSTSMTGRDRHYAQNTRAALRRVAGIDNRGREAVVGERTERKPRRDPEKVAAEERKAAALKWLATREATRQQDKHRRELTEIVARRRAELEAIARLMTRRPDGR